MSKNAFPPRIHQSERDRRFLVWAIEGPSHLG